MSGGPYSRIYHALMDEFPTVYDSDSQLATFVRLLLTADKYYPQHPPMPPRTPTVQALIRHSLIVPSEDHRSFTVKGLEAERERRSAPGKHAASVRWQSARNADAYANAMPDETRIDKTSITANASNGTGSGIQLGYKPKPLPAGQADGLWHRGQHPDCSTCRDFVAVNR
jgi:hypothetical protein